MMENLSMHLLDIGSNSVRAHAKMIVISLMESDINDQIVMEICDDGMGMDENMQQAVLDPFYTTRTTRRIGLGIPLFKELAEQCCGEFKLESKVNVGTRISCSIKKSHWDVPPLGDIGDAIVLLCCMDESIRIRFDYKSDEKEFSFDSQEIREILGDVSICEAEISSWCKAYINENIRGGKENEVVG